MAFATRVSYLQPSGPGPISHTAAFLKSGDFVVSVESFATRTDISADFESVISADGHIYQSSSVDFGSQAILIVVERHIAE